LKIPIRVGVLISGFRGIDELNQVLGIFILEKVMVNLCSLFIQHITMELDLSVYWVDFLIRATDSRNTAEIEFHNGVPYIALDSSYLDRMWWPTTMLGTCDISVFIQTSSCVEVKEIKDKTEKASQWRRRQPGPVDQDTGRLFFLSYNPRKCASSL